MAPVDWSFPSGAWAVHSRAGPRWTYPRRVFNVVLRQRFVLTPTYSFVIPILNEVDTLPELFRRLSSVMIELDGPAEVILVDDGSTDGSFAALEKQNSQDPRFKALRLSRNFGHQLALTAGLDHATGDAVVIMDGDLQDPPEVVLQLAAKWREGFDVVYAVRARRAGETRLKRLTARWFYRSLSRLSEIDMPLDAGDFRIVDRRAVDAVTGMREHARYLRGMFSWVGFEQTSVEYDRDKRVAGETKFPFMKMLRFAFDGIISFSAMPLRFMLTLGFATAVLSFTLGILAIGLKIGGVFAAPGWASVAVAISFLGGAQLTVLGVLGEYIARIHEEVKQRPLYLVGDACGLPGEARAVSTTRQRPLQPR